MFARSTEKDLYKTLGLNQNATSEEIHSAYKKLALKYHPDKVASNPELDIQQAEELFKEINNAYETLHDPIKKQSYDFTFNKATFNSTSEFKHFYKKENPKVNFWENVALKNLTKYGLTIELLQKINKKGFEFNEKHCYALINLVIKRNYTMQDALTEIDGLSTAQAGGIQEGLLRKDVINLQNFWHISALKRLKTSGLTAEMLLNRNENGNEFSNHHCFALNNLITYCNFTLQAALAEIDGLSYFQAGGIEDGLYRQDVINLQNFWHIVALTELKNNGLTAEMLLNRNENGHIFNESHCYTLINLVKKRSFTVRNALAEIEGLSCHEAEEIKSGSTREEVLRHGYEKQNHNVFSNISFRHF